MTQEEKAKRYDEALNTAKDCLKDGTITNTAISYIETIFPELKESDDEKVRKKLIKFFETWNKTNRHCSGVSVNKILTWLEKQGKQKQDPCNNCKDVMLNCHNFPCIKKRAFKQGKSALEAINEEKVDNANKVEQKFHEGQWIVCEELNTAKIINIVGDKYEVEFIDGNKGFPHIDYIDRNFHLWTIKDAKDGDMLACNEEVLLFKSYSVQGRISLYCWYNGQTNIFHSKEVFDTLITTRNKICPATKEQRDLLFKKMREAGYEWDADKKELKKIEDETEIPFGAKDSELQEATYYIPKGFHAEIDDDKVVIKKGEKPTEWSEEDEEILRTIISDGIRGAEFDMLQIDWLKSIKNRYAWKPSDEQMKVLEAMLTVSPQSPTMTSTLIELYEDLKKLMEE